MADKLLKRKIEHVKNADPDVIATGNPGCILQMQLGLRQVGKDVEVVHPIEILDRAYQLRANEIADNKK